MPDLKKYIAPVFATNSDNWLANAVPNGYQSFSNRARFPESWAGLSGEELEKASGIEDAVFCPSGLLEMFQRGSNGNSLATDNQPN